MKALAQVQWPTQPRGSEARQHAACLHCLTSRPHKGCPKVPAQGLSKAWQLAQPSLLHSDTPPLSRPRDPRRRPAAQHCRS